MTRTLSQKMRFLTFVSIALLGYVHGYNLQVGYLAPYSTVGEPLTFTTFFEYLFANGLLRFRIPVLFLISGYLYAQYDQKPWAQRTWRRFRTLMVPYLLWSAIALLITYLCQQFTFSAEMVRQAGIDQLGDNRPYAEIGWQGVLLRWLLFPVAFQLWFILALFIYNALYPVIRWMLARVPLLWLGFTGLLWFTLFHLRWIEGQGLFFFSLGVWLQKRPVNMEREPRWFSLGLAWNLFLGLCISKTFMAFELEPESRSTAVILTVLHHVAVLSGILAVWFSVDRLAQWWMNRHSLREATSYAFFIYGLHVPALQYLMTAVLTLAGSFALIRLASYILIPLLVILCCIGLGYLTRKALPGFYRLLTGGRGLG